MAMSVEETEILETEKRLNRWIRRQIGSHYLPHMTLVHTKVMRKGSTEKHWYREKDVQVFVSHQKESGNLSFFLMHPSKGGGYTQIEVLVNPRDFPALLSFMSRTDPEAARKAMLEELRYRICGNDPPIGS
jgi:hypothetical protein